MVKKMKEKHDWLAVILEKETRDRLLEPLAKEIFKEKGNKGFFFSPHPVGDVEVIVFHGTADYINRIYASLRFIVRAIPSMHASLPGIKMIIIDKEGVIDV